MISKQNQFRLLHLIFCFYQIDRYKSLEFYGRFFLVFVFFSHESQKSKSKNNKNWLLQNELIHIKMYRSGILDVEGIFEIDIVCYVLCSITIVVLLLIFWFVTILSISIKSLRKSARTHVRSFARTACKVYLYLTPCVCVFVWVVLD